MNNICVKFHAWTFLDEIYGFFENGDIVTFSIGCEQNEFIISDKQESYLKHKKLSNYYYSGKVIYKCTDCFVSLIVIDTGKLILFISDDKETISSISTGQYIQGEGELYVDYMDWMSVKPLNPNTGDADDTYAPDIYYQFKIIKLYELINEEGTNEKEETDLGSSLFFPPEHGVVELRNPYSLAIAYIEMEILKRL